jgi:phospholipid/cholesterol/gamma-HCH transport system permease protein
MSSIALRVQNKVGRVVLDGLAAVGAFSTMVLDMIRGLSEWRVWVPRALDECWNIGVGSMFIVLLISGFAGAVTAFQTGYQFTGNIPIYVVGSLVSESVILELGPVLVGLILAGRIGAAYAAELGTMRVTEQIDALESLGRSPASHLLIPRVAACLLMIPVLTIFGDVIGIVAGFIGAKQALPISTQDFVYGARAFFRPFDAYYSVIKAFFFAGAISLISCYRGFNTKQGAEGVGKSTTGAVVTASIVILLLDTVLAKVLLNP